MPPLKSKPTDQWAALLESELRAESVSPRTTAASSSFRSYANSQACRTDGTRPTAGLPTS